MVTPAIGQGRAWIDRGKKLLQSSVARETDGYTFSHTLGPNTSFTLHAAKTFQHDNGRGRCTMS